MHACIILQSYEGGAIVPPFTEENTEMSGHSGIRQRHQLWWQTQPSSLVLRVH